MKPTTFPTAVATAVPTPAQELLVQAPLDTGAIALRPEQVPQAEQALAALDFAAIPSGDIIKIGLGAEQELHETLANIGYALIALHAVAAIYHHHVLKDNTLTNMLPERRS